MSRIEYEFKGKGHDGDLLVVDGQLPNLRTEAFPAYVQTLPKAPRLTKGQKAVLTYEGTQVKWHVREPRGVSSGQSAGISITTVIAILFVWEKIKKWRKSLSEE